MVNPSNERRVVQDEEGGYAVYPSKAEVWDKSGGICWYCGKVLHPFRDFTIDHFVPMVRRGTEAIENLVPACRDCNSRKGHRPLEYLREALAGREGARLTPEQKA